MVKFVSYVAVRNGKIAGEFRSLETAVRKRPGCAYWKVTKYYDETKLVHVDVAFLV